MTKPFEPYLNFRDERDLLLVERRFVRRPGVIRLPKARYGEITAWVAVKLSPDDVFSAEGQLIFGGETSSGTGWRLSLTQHGYLTFEIEGKGGFTFSGWIPVHSYFDKPRVMRLGLALRNNPHPLLLDHAAGRRRLSKSTVESYSVYDYSSRLSLLVGVGESGPLVSCGDAKRLNSLQLQAIPERIQFQQEGIESLCGQLLGFTAFQTERYDMVGDPTLKSARAAFPLTPGGGAFAPKWVDSDTAQFWQQPEFCSSTSSWMYTRVEDRSGRLRRLRVNPRGGFNMMPTFFICDDRGGWRRIAPEAVRMGWDATEYGFDLKLTPKQAAGSWVACAIPFLESDCRELIDWAHSTLGAEVETIGESVLGRPIELIRVGSATPKMRIALLFGQHSPLEIMAAHLIRPLLLEARKSGLFEHVEFHIAPMINVDCARFGGNGLNANQLNTNRHWFDNIQPENEACIRYFDRLRANGQTFDFAIDFHAGGTFRNHLVFYPADVVGPAAPKGVLEKITPWREALEIHAGFRRRDSRASKLDRLRASDYFIRQHKCPAIIVELSTASYFDPNKQASLPFSPAALTVAGKGIARAVEQKVKGGGV